uniref:Ig-like domain-containing protein n=1 Tax=Haplochromis burtoni TaxID=8153 RepID=A0A3Q2WDL0_HAPBU
MFFICLFCFAFLFSSAAGTHPYLSVRIGNEITLACQNREDFNKSCNSTTWLFGASRSFITVPLFEHGKIHNDARSKSGRLSVTENCSLVIKNITSLDDGRYNCRQFISGKQVSNFMVFLSIVKLSIRYFIFLVFLTSLEKDSASTRTTASSTTTAKPKSEGSISSATTTQAPTTAVVTTSPSTTVINSKTTITTTKTKSPMRTTFTKSVTTTTTVVESLMTKNTTTSIVIRTKAISLGTIRITTSNTTVTTIKSPTKTTTFNSTTTITSTKSHTTRNTTESTTATTTIKSSRAAQECPNAGQYSFSNPANILSSGS